MELAMLRLVTCPEENRENGVIIFMHKSIVDLVTLTVDYRSSLSPH